MRRSLAPAVVAALLVVAVLATSACTKDKGTSTPNPSGSATSPSPSPLEKGVYGWDAYGVDALLTPGSSAWTLKITNTSGAKIEAPGIYALKADTGDKVMAVVAGAKPLSDGESATLDVTWPADFNARDNAGMIMLTIGPDLYGGFDRGR